MFILVKELVQGSELGRRMAMPGLLAGCRGWCVDVLGEGRILVCGHIVVGGKGTGGILNGQSDLRMIMISAIITKLIPIYCSLLPTSTLLPAAPCPASNILPVYIPPQRASCL